MTPDIDAIVTAERAAQREVDAVSARLHERVRLERERLERARAAEAAAAQARVDDEASALERESQARVAGRRRERTAVREARRTSAAASVAAAVAAYVAIVAGESER